MFLQLYGLHFIKHLEDFATNTYIRHQSCMCQPYHGDLKVLNHRSKDFYFFMYIFGWFSREFPLENYRYACFDYPASASDDLIGLDFSWSSVNLAQKKVLSVTQANASKVATRCRSDACGSYSIFEKSYWLINIFRLKVCMVRQSWQWGGW